MGNGTHYASSLQWLACKNDEVSGFMMDGDVTEKVRHDWYQAIPSLREFTAGHCGLVRMLT